MDISRKWVCKHGLPNNGFLNPLTLFVHVAPCCTKGKVLAWHFVGL